MNGPLIMIYLSLLALISLTDSGNVSFLAIKIGTPTSLVSKLGSGEMTDLAA